jgi:hypothetical protein
VTVAFKAEEMLWMFNVKVHRGISESKRDSEKRIEKITQSGNSYFLPSRNTVTTKNKKKRNVKSRKQALRKKRCI